MTESPFELGIDLMSGEFFGSDPFGAYAWMREHAPAYYDESNDLWALTRYDDVKSAGTDPAVFSNAGGCPAGPRTSSAGWSPCRSPSPPPTGWPRPDPLAGATRLVSGPGGGRNRDRAARDQIQPH